MGQLYLIPDFKNIEESCTQAEKWGAAFEYNDFFRMELMDDKKALKERISFYKAISRDRSKDTLHGAFFHTNLIAGFNLPSYLERWLLFHKEFLTELLKEYRGIQIYMENMFDKTPEMLFRLASELNHPDFGICYDVAHGNLGPCAMEEWFSRLHPYIMHLHVNDNDGKADQHRAVGSGSINWAQFDGLMKKYKPEAGILAEVSSFVAKEESLHYMKEKHIYPFW